MRPSRIKILGVPVDCVNMSGAVARVEELILGNQAVSVIAVNPEKVIKANDDSSLKDLISSAALLIPDGIGVVWAARFLNIGLMSRVPGSELMPEICALSEKKDYSVFLFGASPDVNAKATAEIKRRYPQLCVAGSHHGYVSDGEMDGLVSRINRSGAQVLFIALGSPAQELWMSSRMPQLSTVRVCQGVGGTFDVLAGTVKRAPAFFLACHLEWLYRLASQPTRILRQTALPRFFIRVLCLRLRGTRA